MSRIAIWLCLAAGLRAQSFIVATPAATFNSAPGGSATSPASAVTNLSVSSLASGETGIPFTATPSAAAGTPANLANWIFVSLGGSTPGSVTVSGTLTTTPVPLTITVNPGILPLLTGPIALDGQIAITTPSSLTSNSPLTISVTLSLIILPTLIFSDAADSGVTCGPPDVAGNLSCTAKAAYTIGQTNSAPPAYTTVLTLVGDTPDQLTISSNQPWLIPSRATSRQAVTPIGFAIDLTKLPTPVTAGPLSAVVTAREVNGPEMATFSVNLTVAAAPVINLTALTCLPANPVTPGTPSVTCTSSAALSSAPTSPATLPAMVSASIGSGPCIVTPASSTIALSTATTPLSFTIGPSSGTWLFASCTLNVGIATTGGITPVITASDAATISVFGPPPTAAPTSQVINLPTLAAPAYFTETIQQISDGGNNVAVPFTCTPSIALPPGGNWLACTGGTTTTVPPFATSTVTVTSSGLAQGLYGGSVAYSLAQLGVTSNPPNVPVTLNIGALSVTGGPVNFQHQFGVTTPATATLMVSAGPAAINWVASAPVPSAGTPNCNWLVPGASSGTTPGAGGSGPVSVSYNPALLPNQNQNGSYQCTINYSAAASYGSTALPIPVVVTLSAGGPPPLSVTPPTAQIISAPPGSTTPVSATFSISALDSFSNPPNTIPISVAPTPAGNGFTGNPPGVFTASLSSPTTPAILTIAGNPTGVALGTYTGQFTVSAPSLGTLQVNVVVQFVIGGPCAFMVNPSGIVDLTNTVPANGSPPASVPGTFTVGPPPSNCEATTAWTASSNVPWLIITSGATGNGSATVTGTYHALSNPTTSSRTATITITPAAGTPVVVQFTQTGSMAPILLRQVTALYQSILDRDPDPMGYQFWTAGSAGLSQMADDFLTSPEAFNTGFAVMAAFQAGTGVPPTYFEFLSAATAIRSGAQTIDRLFSDLAANNPNYSATNLYQNLLGRAPAGSDSACISSGLAACFPDLIGYPATAAPVHAADNEFQSTGIFQSGADHTNALYITMLYFVILGRDPDPGGLQYWLGIANGGGAGLLFQGAAGYPTRLQIVGPAPGQGFIGSPEFQALFQ